MVLAEKSHRMLGGSPTSGISGTVYRPPSMRKEATHGCPHCVNQQILRLEVGSHFLGSKNALTFPISIRISQHAEMDDATAALQ